ncbi:hypothetical protein BH09PAT4_BH09PAT4_03080 [soil metagenome]
MGKRRYSLKKNKVLLIAFPVLVLAIMAINGFLPNMVGSLTSRYIDYGWMECGSQSLSALAHSKCAFVGGDTGDVLTNDTPLIAAGALILRTTPLSVEWAYFIVAGVLISLALVGTYKLIRAMKTSPVVALAGASLYLLLPIIMSLQGFGGTYWGIILIPAALYVVWWQLLQLKNASRLRVAKLAALWLFVSGFMLFMDGYGFFMYALASVILITTTIWPKWKARRTLLSYGIFFVSLLVPYAIYTHLIPSSSAWTDSMDLFRAMGLDIVTLIIPAPTLWWVQVTGLDFGVASRLWGDGTNATYNYIGILMLGLSIFGVYSMRKKLSRLGLALLIIGGTAFILSLGPSLKINSQRPPLGSGPVSHASYLMPKEDAVVTLPTEILEKNAPGLKAMRAAYRWHTLTVLVLLIFALKAVQILIERKKMRLAFILLALMCVELLPNPIKQINRNFENRQQMSAFNDEVIGPLRKFVGEGDRVVYFPNSLGNNDFLAIYMTPVLQAWTYNIGGDKAQLISYPRMPKEVIELIRADDDESQVRRIGGARMKDVLAKGYANKIIVPTFDLRWDSYSWPPATIGSLVRAQDAVISARNAGLRIETSDRFYVVTEN